MLIDQYGRTYLVLFNTIWLQSPILNRSYLTPLYCVAELIFQGDMWKKINNEVLSMS